MMKKLLPLLLALMLAALPAYAENLPLCSEEVHLLHTANAALYDQYGLTLPTLGLFDVSVDRYPGLAIVTYWPRSAPEYLAGRYAVLISSGETTVHWTLADDPDAWREPELSAFLAEDPWLDGEPGSMVVLQQYRLDGDDQPDYPDLEPARAAAVAAVQAFYGLTDEQAAALSPVRTNRYEYADGHRTWQVSLYQRGPIEVNFSVTIDIGTGMVLDISHWCGVNG